MGNVDECTDPSWGGLNVSLCKMFRDQSDLTLPQMKGKKKMKLGQENLKSLTVKCEKCFVALCQ